jgi:hypothetical protein
MSYGFHPTANPNANLGNLGSLLSLHRVGAFCLPLQFAHRISVDFSSFPDLSYENTGTSTTLEAAEFGPSAKSRQLRQSADHVVIPRSRTAGCLSCSLNLAQNLPIVEDLVGHFLREVPDVVSFERGLGEVSAMTGLAGQAFTGVSGLVD